MDTIVRTATFDPKVKTYWFLQGAAVHALMITAFVGLFSLPFWLLGGGQWLSARRFARMSATLTTKAIHLKTGGLVQVEKTIPLEQIQDLSLRSGPLLDFLGLASVQVETAGQSAQGAGDMTLPGLVDAAAFRDAVLKQREALIERRATERGTTEPTAAPADDAALLTEIRDSLLRIEAHLARTDSNAPPRG